MRRDERRQPRSVSRTSSAIFCSPSSISRASSITIRNRRCAVPAANSSAASAASKRCLPLTASSPAAPASTRWRRNGSGRSARRIREKSPSRRRLTSSLHGRSNRPATHREENMKKRGSPTAFWYFAAGPYSGRRHRRGECRRSRPAAHGRCGRNRRRPCEQRETDRPHPHQRRDHHHHGCEAWRHRQGRSADRGQEDRRRRRRPQIGRRGR